MKKVHYNDPSKSNHSNDWYWSSRIVAFGGQKRDEIIHYFGEKHKAYNASREKIILRIRARLFIWSFYPEEKELNEVPVVTFSDLVRLPTSALRRRNFSRYLEFIRDFRAYRRNLHYTSWSSLTMIYPRLLYLWVYYLLFWWGEYCGVLPELLNDPDSTLIPELFITYFVKLDSIIDGENGKEYLLKEFPSVKRKCADILTELLTHIWKNKRISQIDAKKKLCDMIWKFRQNGLIVSRNVYYLSDFTFADMLNYKDKTAAEMWRVWVALLCDVYHVETRANSSREIFGLVWMAIQVVDDMLDAPTDYRGGVGNIFNHLLKETGELSKAREYFEGFPYSHLDWAWANKYLPCTCKRAAALIDDCINTISTISEDPVLTSELCSIIKSWRDISLPERYMPQTV